MTAENTELLKRILTGKQTRPDKIELGTLMLEFYEKVEENLIKEHGIHIRLDLYEGVDACICGNRLGIWLCLERILYSFIENCSENSTIEFAMKNKENRIWVIFRRMKGREEIRRKSQGKSMDDTVKEYLESQDILLRITEKPEYKVEIGFCDMDGR